MGADKARLLPVEEVDVVKTGRGTDGHGVATSQSEPLLSSGTIGKQRRGRPEQAVGGWRDLQVVSDRVLLGCSTGQKERVRHRDGNRAARTHLSMYPSRG